MLLVKQAVIQTVQTKMLRINLLCQLTKHYV